MKKITKHVTEELDNYEAVKDIKKASAEEGYFKAYVPLKANADGNFLVVKEVDGVKKNYLVGEASNVKIDKGDDRVSKSFLNKMVDMIKGINVFAEHEYGINDTLGYIDDAYMDTKSSDSMIVSTCLEPADDNEIVGKILKKIEHGTNMFYSIAGKITKATRKFDDVAKKTIRELMDGEIYEISVTPLPEGDVGFLSPMMKSMNKMFDDIPGDDNDKDGIEVEFNEDDITKALEEIVESENLSNQLYDFFWAFRSAIYDVTYSSDLTPEQKSEKINSLAGEYSSKVESISSSLADLTEKIANDLT